MVSAVRHPNSRYWAIMIFVFAVGCGSESDGYKGARGNVHGKLVINGEPLPEGCLVAFQAIEGGYLATATVKSEGKYTLTFKGSFDIPATKYRVQLSPPAVVEAVTPTSTGLQNPSEMAKKVMGPPGSAKLKDAAKPPFPAKYLSTTTSKLEYTVEPGSNTADFDLTP